MADPPHTWARLDTAYYDDPKIIRAGEAAEVLFVRAIAWSKRNGTDGWLPGNLVERLVAEDGTTRAGTLVAEGAFTVDERGGYFIPAFARWQETTEEIEAWREELRRRGRRGAEVRWGDDDGHGDGPGGGHSGGHSGGHATGHGTEMARRETRDVKTRDVKTPPSPTRAGATRAGASAREGAAAATAEDTP